MRRLAIVCIAGWLVACPTRSDAGVFDVVNLQRTKGCAGSATPGAPLRISQELNDAASLLPNGVSPLTAAEQSGYRGTHIRVIYLPYYVSDRRAAEVLARDHCTSIGNLAFIEVGAYRRGADAWIVLATPYPLPTAEQFDALRDSVFALVNQARIEGRRCGDQEWASAPPVEYSFALEQAALIHAQEMAIQDVVTHDDSNGDRVGERVAQAGYLWEAVGENIAAGQNHAHQVVAGWLASPGHCANIMNSRFAHMGVAFATNGDSKFGVYWTQVFATPQPPPPPPPVKAKRPWWKGEKK